MPSAAMTMLLLVMLMAGGGCRSVDARVVVGWRGHVCAIDFDGVHFAYPKVGICLRATMLVRCSLAHRGGHASIALA